MKKRIVIIGGGMAGLGAASFLVRTGCEVTLLEAKERIGGRIHTVITGGRPIELGAEFLHGESPAMLNAIRAAGLSTKAMVDDYQIFRDGRLRRMDFFGKMGEIIDQVPVRHDDCNFEDFLTAQHLNPADRTLAISYIEGFHAARPGWISAHSLRRAEYSASKMQGTKQSRVQEGYGALASFLEQEIRAHGGNVVCNAIVNRVEWRPGSVEVTFRQGSRQLLAGADAAVITLPLGVLKAGTVNFLPPLTAKREAIQQMHFGNVVKVIFEFRDSCWPDFGFIVAPDEPLPTWWTDVRGPVLTGWAGGPKAEALLGCSAGELERLGLKTLARIFPERAGEFSEQLASCHVFNWAKDPFTLGAYSYLPVNGLDLPKLLGAPVADTLFFAGEATITDGQTGMVFGAFETGLRAGREILAAIADTSPEAVYPLQK